ncbi:MAG: NAD(P)-dependent oxidoreductase [Rhodobacterales bacterium]|nr:NAD(P)-dependent oxidoreductase [Rhodobacterales bacterium]
MTGQSVLITGASGFIGRATVLQLRARGFAVQAVVRRAQSIPDEWAQDPEITPVICDLARSDLDLDGVDCVIHAAASLVGNDAQQACDTITATHTVLRAINAQTKPPHLILLSSITVYDTLSLSVGATLDEGTALEQNSARRDAYCRAKIAQETLTQKAANDVGFPLSILRAGAVFGPDRVWNGHIGVALGPVLLRFGGRGQVPLCALSHCAAALVRAVEIRPPPHAPHIVNILDDDLPNRKRFVQILRNSGWPKRVLPLPWRALDILARIVSLLPVKAPGLLRRPVLHARLKPLKYSNARLHDLYGLESEFWFETAMLRAIDPTIFEPKND